MIVMLATGIGVPMMSAHAMSKTHSTTSLAAQTAAPTADTAAVDVMPCHKPAKPCPHCPQTGCGDMGACMAKCFQSMAMPAGEMHLQGRIIGAAVRPERSQVAAGALVAPLLRPPTV